MKKLILMTAAMGAIGFASPALADGNNRSTDTETYTINAVNPAKCNIVTQSRSFNLPNNQISDRNGFADAGLASAVAQRLNDADITAWCTGNSNSFVASRSALTTGDGDVTNGFSQGVIYDLQANIADSGRAQGGSVTEGTSDGPGNGPGVGAGAGNPITRFGPTGDGSQVTFAQEQGSTVSAVGNGANSTEAPRSAYTDLAGTRLVAGSYSGTVTLTLTPGV